MKGPEADDFVAEINMTPFVDIVLVLLIIFMISAPLFETKFDVDLPVTQSSKENGKPPKQFEVCIVHKNGNIEFMNKTFKSVSNLNEYLKEAKLTPDIPIFIRADDQITYGIVTRVLAGLRDKGVMQVSLVTRTGNEP